jgi:hypothetical protein
MNGNETDVTLNKQPASFQYCFRILSLVYKEKRYKDFLTSKASAGKVLQQVAGSAALYSVRRE